MELSEYGVVKNESVESNVVECRLFEGAARRCGHCAVDFTVPDSWKGWRYLPTRVSLVTSPHRPIPSHEFHILGKRKRNT